MSEGAKTSLLDLLADPQAEPAAILAKRLELDQEAFLLSCTPTDTPRADPLHLRWRSEARA
jgi:hypothetical protein